VRISFSSWLLLRRSARRWSELSGHHRKVQQLQQMPGSVLEHRPQGCRQISGRRTVAFLQRWGMACIAVSLAILVVDAELRRHHRADQDRS
jgi:hypothetical protein